MKPKQKVTDTVAFYYIQEDLFRQTANEQKKSLLEQDGIVMTEELERSIDDMCNYSALVNYQKK